MTQEQRIIALAEAIGTDIKEINIRQGDLTTLSTTDKNTLVSAINEVFTIINTSSSGITQEDLNQALERLKNELTAGASAALDTFDELAIALGNDSNFATTIATGLSNRLRFDERQNLTAAQKLQACENIGIGNPSRNFVNDYNTAKAS